MNINVFNNYGEISFNYEKIIEDVKIGFKDEIVENVDVSVILVNLEEIHEINKQYRHIDRPTDVISFENDDEEDYLGDIFICIDKVIDQANNYGHSVEREFAFLLIHGLLHLNGFDHIEKEDETVMFKKQDEILEKIKYGRN